MLKIDLSQIQRPRPPQQQPKSKKPKSENPIKNPETPRKTTTPAIGTPPRKNTEENRTPNRTPDTTPPRKIKDNSLNMETIIGPKIQEIKSADFHTSQSVNNNCSDTRTHLAEKVITAVNEKLQDKNHPLSDKEKLQFLNNLLNVLNDLEKNFESTEDKIKYLNKLSLEKKYIRFLTKVVEEQDNFAITELAKVAHFKFDQFI